MRSPTFKNRLFSSITSGSSPLRRQAGGTLGIGRGAWRAAASASAAMWAGVVPQHPPTMFKKPLAMNSSTTSAICSGVSSYSPNSFGSPAFGWAETSVSATPESSSMCGRISAAPKAQLRPIARGAAWRTECQNAVGVWPDRVRPLASVMVPEITTGSSNPQSSKHWCTAKMAALQLSVSNTVSIRMISTPPSINAAVASR